MTSYLFTIHLETSFGYNVEADSVQDAVEKMQDVLDTPDDDFRQRIDENMTDSLPEVRTGTFVEEEESGELHCIDALQPQATK